MKRLGSSDSLGASLMSICPIAEEHSPRNTHVYSREFQSVLDGFDEEGCIEESGHIAEKKRRLSIQQVKALEKNFEVENKLEPERKVRLAQELGLQPRQVAVWFQNRRARYKTKQLERDYGILKASYDKLKLNYDSLQLDNEALLKEIKELKSKLNDENSESNLSIKEEVIVSETENKTIEQSEPPLAAIIAAASDSRELDYDAFHNANGAGILIFPDLKDGLSDDSDSSSILNEDNNSPNAAISSSGVLQNYNNNHLVMSPTSSSLRFNCSSSSSHSSLNCLQFSDSRANLSNTQKAYQPQFVKLEEHNFFSGEEACNFFSDEQAPSLHWYCPDQWN